LNIRTLAELREFCGILAGTDMVPKAYKGKPDDILVAMMHGQEVGIPHLQALQSIAVVNGIPSIYGDAALALVRASGKLMDIDEWSEVDGKRMDGPFPIISLVDEGKTVVAYCKTTRAMGDGMGSTRTTWFSVDDAKRAGLWMKKGASGFPTPWCTVPQRMLMFRARGWNLRDQFSDVLKGLAFYEEAIDIEPAEAKIEEAAVITEVNKASLDAGKAALAEKRGEPMRPVQPSDAGLASMAPVEQPVIVDLPEGVPPTLRVVTDHEFSVPEAQLQRDAFGEGVLARIRKEWNLEAGSYPAKPEDRSIYLECLWDGIREQLAEAKRRKG
jgi:hypothetical protein